MKHICRIISDHDSCVHADGIQPMELGDQEEQLMDDDLAENEVVMSSDVEMASRTPSVDHEVQDIQHIVKHHTT